MGEIEYRFVEEEIIKDFKESEWEKFNSEKGYTYVKKELWLGAFYNNEAIGYAKFNIVGGVGNLKELIVKKQERKKGVGKRLLDMFIEYCKEQGCHKLTLKTTPKIMENAYNLYLKKGFEVEAELKDDEFHTDDVIMSKRLD